MSKIIMVTGGARSGKSSFAENKILELGDKIIYMATARPIDEGMKDRIRKHRLSRPKEWETIEQHKNFKILKKNESFIKCEAVLLDCITILITNLMLESNIDFDKCTMEEVNKLEIKIKNEILDLVDVIRETDKNIIFVTNEVGMGLVPEYMMGNYFRDIAGRINQEIGVLSDEVYFLVSGIPQKIK